MNETQIPAGQMVNKVGKYLYKHIDGAFKIQFSPNTCDVYMFMYYQQPGQDMKEKKFDISITTYQKKIRVDTIELTSMEKCLGCDVYKPEELVDLQEARDKIYNKVVNHISKEYQEYDFVF